MPNASSEDLMQLLASMGGGGNGSGLVSSPAPGGNGIWGNNGWVPGGVSTSGYVDPANLPNVVNGVQMSPGMGSGFSPGEKGTTPGASGYDAQDIYGMKANPNAAAGTPFASYLHGGNGNGPVGFDRGGAMLAMRAMNAGLDPSNFLGVGGHGQLARALMTPNVQNAGQTRQAPHVDTGGGAPSWQGGNGAQNWLPPQGGGGDLASRIRAATMAMQTANRRPAPGGGGMGNSPPIIARGTAR